MIECLTDATVAAYVDGALGLDEVGRVDHHIDSCVQCRAQLSTVAASPHSFTSEIAGSTPGLAALVQQTIATGRAGDPLPETALGRYVIDEVIGRGGMGVVVRARDPELDRFIAIKLVDPARRRGAWRVHVREEARAMAKLRHPNVVAVYDAGSIGDQLFIAMELVDGSSLARWRGREPARALAACLDAGRGLCAAHAVGLVHGDIKPDNILVGVDGRALIGDFGLARAIADNGVRGVAGTPGYMAPELRDGGAATVASDQYAFAVTLYEVLVGERPAIARSSVAARPRVLPRRLWRVIERGLASEPAARFPTMEAFVAALERAVRPRRRVAIAAGTVAVLGGAIAWFGVAHDAPGACADPIERSLAIAPPGCTGAACAPLAARALAWRTTSVGVCEATRAGRQSEALLDRRMRCLDQRRLEHAEIARQAASPGARVALERLDTPESCATLDGGGPALRFDQLPADGLARGWIATATTSNALGHYQQAYDELAPHFATIRALGEGSLTAEAAQLLGDVQLTLGKLDGAAASFDVGLRAAAAAGDDIASAELLLRLAHEAGESREQWDRAEELVRAADAAVVRAGSPKKLQALLAKAQGLVAEAREKIPEAIADYARGVELYRTLGAPAALSNALQLQCAAEVRMGEFALAQAHCAEAVTIDQQALGPDHPFVAEAETNLGFVAVTQHDFHRARAIWERALARLDRGHDDDVLGVATVLVNLGTVALIDDTPAATRYLTRLQSITASAQTSPKSLDIQTRMADLLFETDPPAGVRVLEDVTRRAEAALGLANRTTSHALEDLGYAYHRTGKLREAKAAFKRNVESARLLYGERNIRTLSTEGHYGEALLELGDTAEARPLLERIVLAVEQLQPGSAFLAEAYTNLADCLLQLGDAAHAEDYAKRGLAIREQRGDDALQESEVRFILGKAMWKARKDPKAIEVVTRSRDEMRAIGQRATTLPEVETWLKQARAR